MVAWPPSRDVPKLEVYPWAFWGVLTALWPLLWFFLWAALQGTVASLAVSSGSLRDLRWLPFLIPGLLLLGIGCVGWIGIQLRSDRNFPLPALAFLVLLLTAFAPGAFYMVTLLNRMTPYELTRSFTSIFFQVLLADPALDWLTLLLCIGLGGLANRIAFRNKYAGIQPAWKSAVYVVWILGSTGGLLIGLRWGTVLGILFAAGLGNLVTILAYRKSLSNSLKRIPAD